ncbi:putative peptidase (DUF1758) domain-containing protein [Phthorimaea operculella]|nr:putative peptidase (DUF1758) domain-containing protein [Phthorimaea operculella]
MLTETPDEMFACREEMESQYYLLVAQARTMLEKARKESDPEFQDAQPAVVKVVDSDGNRHDARLLLDNASSANLISESFCGKLGLPRRKVHSTVTGVNNQTSSSTVSCTLTIESYYSDYSVNIDCKILPEITMVMPSSYIDFDHIPLPSGVQLADPSFNIPSVIDILVGAEVFWDVFTFSSMNLKKAQLYETKLGWIVSSPLITGTCCELVYSHIDIVDIIKL